MFWFDFKLPRGSIIRTIADTEEGARSNFAYLFPHLVQEVLAVSKESRVLPAGW